MDVSSQEKFIQNGENSTPVEAMSELNQEVNSRCDNDEKALENHENAENHKSFEAVNGSSICDPVGLEKLGNPPADVSKHSSLDQLEATPQNETNQISHGRNEKKGRSKKREKRVIGSPRVLRSRSQEKPKVPEPVTAPAQDVGSKERKRRKKQQMKEDQNNEFSKIRRHLRYLLSRMSYEQNFIDAYAGEGWKGQSLEKIRPEKELERAKSYIIRYKLKIRDLFQRIDTSCEEGRIPESLYDSEGLIDSEDIFCAKCGQSEVRLDNDIILCDGECERGFHQFCLDPPLLKEQVPPGDEGWLCPACDCKVDCVDLLNDSLGTDLSISDSWEKVFPESVASGNKLDDISGLPSDDSEDDDYNPDGPEVNDEVDEEESSSDESDSSSASEDLGAVANNDQLLGLPSEDSEEDDDYNPDRVASDDEAKSKSSSSDFTSDSEDFGDVNKDEGSLAEVQGPLMDENNKEMPKVDMEADGFGPITAKRCVERLDYKKLHDETYGNVSSDSSDEDFFDSEAPKRRKNIQGDKDKDFSEKQKENQSTPLRRIRKKLDVEGASGSLANTGSSPLASSDKSGTKSSHKKLGDVATQSLYEYFKENHYPDRNAKENLAKELNLTHNQVSKWFENARWSFNHPGTRNKAPKTVPKTLENKQINKESAETLITKRSNESRSNSSKSKKKKAKTDDDYQHKTEITEASPNQSVRRSGRIQPKSIAKPAS